MMQMRSGIFLQKNNLRVMIVVNLWPAEFLIGLKIKLNLKKVVTYNRLKNLTYLSFNQYKSIVFLKLCVFLEQKSQPKCMWAITEILVGLPIPSCAVFKTRIIQKNLKLN